MQQIHYIIEVPEQSIPATGVMDYITLMVPIDIPADRWVKASEYLPGDRTVLHHTLNAVVDPGTRLNPRNILGASGGGDGPEIAAYVPGGSPRMMPENTGGLLKAGSTLFLQLHYTIPEMLFLFVLQYEVKFQYNLYQLQKEL